MTDLWEISVRSGRENGVWVEFPDRGHSRFFFYPQNSLVHLGILDDTCATREYWDKVSEFVRKVT